VTPSEHESYELVKYASFDTNCICKRIIIYTPALGLMIVGLCYIHTVVNFARESNAIMHVAN